VRTAIQKVLLSDPAELAVDFSGVTYMDSSALAPLVESLRIANKQQTRLVIDGLSDQPRYLMEVTHLDRLFDIAKVETTHANS
jgi:anti-sigma B factor antagonist